MSVNCEQQNSLDTSDTRHDINYISNLQKENIGYNGILAFLLLDITMYPTDLNTT